MPKGREISIDVVDGRRENIDINIESMIGSIIGIR